MAEISKNFISFVALGRPNPQILNVDFLKDNKIVPVDEPPFDELFKKEKPFTKFLSTPVLSNLVLENIDFLVDEGRFQIRDTAISEWTETKIFEIATKYFEVLPYTPLKVVGINLSATITFDTQEEAANFQQLFLPQNSKLTELISKDDIIADLVLRYPYSDSTERIKLMFNQPNDKKDKRIVNLNYEFDFTNWDEFNSELGKISEIAKYFDSILGQLLEAV